MADEILVAENIEGSLHDAVWSVNQRKLASYVVTMSYHPKPFHMTVVVYRVSPKLDLDDVLPEAAVAANAAFDWTPPERST